MVTQISFGVLDAKGGRTDVGVKSTLVATCDCPVLGADGAGSRLRYALRDAGFTEDFCPQACQVLNTCFVILRFLALFRIRL